MTTLRSEILQLGRRLVVLSEELGSDEAAVRYAAHECGKGLKETEAAIIDGDLRFAIRWAKCGFPQIVTPHKLAASFMATSVSADAVCDVVFPWPTFVVTIPTGMIQIFSATGSAWEPQAAWICPSGNGHQLLLRSEKGSVIIREIASASDLAIKASFDLHIPEGDAVVGNMTDVFAHNERALLLVSRLVLGACIELDRPKHREVIGRGRPVARTRKGRAGSDEPSAWTFSLTRDVRVDCREWVVSYLRGEKGTKWAVQSLTRGHHKRQPYGPRSELRKWIHIEPHWRGDVDAPIAIRSHRL